MSQSIACEHIANFTEIAGKTVLEIGGNSSCAAAIPFIDLGAQAVIVSGLDHIYSSIAPADIKYQDKITLQKANALDLLKTFGQQQFDIIYGISVLEHIPNPDLLMNQLYYVLKDGGFIFLEGAPVWTSAKGHHIWVDRWNYPVTRNYYFSDYPGHDAINPIPDWGHLIYSQKELRNLLADSGLPSQDIMELLKFIYESANINRITPANILRAVSRTPFVCSEVNYLRRAIPLDVKERLMALHSSNQDYSIDSMRLVLSKLSSKN